MQIFIFILIGLGLIFLIRLFFRNRSNSNRGSVISGNSNFYSPTDSFDSTSYNASSTTEFGGGSFGGGGSGGSWGDSDYSSGDSGGDGGGDGGGGD